MTKSTFAIIIMGIIMVAMLAFGGSFAYFTAATKEQSGSFTTALVQLNGAENQTISLSKQKLVVPKDTFTASVTLASKSTVATFVFFTVDLDTAAGSTSSLELAETNGVVATGFTVNNFTDNNGTTDNAEDDVVVYYVEVDAATEQTAKTVPVVLSLVYDATAHFDEDGTKPTEMQETCTVKLTAFAIQKDNIEAADGKTAAQVAYEAYMNEVTTA